MIQLKLTRKGMEIFRYIPTQSKKSRVMNYFQKWLNEDSVTSSLRRRE